MHQQRVQPGRLFGQDARCNGVHCMRQLRLALGLVHRGIGSRVDDDTRRDIAHRLAYRIGIGQIHGPGIQRDHLAQTAERTPQFPADLATGAGEENAVSGER